MAKTILTTQPWVNVLLIGVNVVVNSRWRTVYSLIGVKFVENQDSLYVILKNYEHRNVFHNVNYNITHYLVYVS